MSRIDEIVAKHDIHDVLVQYCRGVDRVERDVIAATFHPDARCEFGELLLEGPTIADTIATAAGGCHITTHMVGNAIIALDGDVARSELYYLSSSVVDAPDGDGRQLRMRAGRYVDRIERRDGRWRIADRVVVEDWCRFTPLLPTPPGASFRPGAQGAGDPLYGLIGFPSAAGFAAS